MAQGSLQTRADGLSADVAGLRVVPAQDVPAAGGDLAVLHAELPAADRAGAAARFAAAAAAGCTHANLLCRLAAAGAEHDALAADVSAFAVPAGRPVGRPVGRAAGVDAPDHAIEAGAYRAAAVAALHKAVLAEALPAEAARADARAVLVAAGAAHGAAPADQAHAGIGIEHGVGAQVAATLARAALGAFTLAVEADGVAAGGAAADVAGAGAFAAGPALRAASFAVLVEADRAGKRAAGRAEDVAAGGALAQAAIAAGMAVAAEDGLGNGLAAGVAGGLLERAGVAVQADAQARLRLAVGQRHVGDGGRQVEDGVADQVDAHAQPVVLDLLGDLALEVGFEQAALFA